ncbi:MAG TPA: serine hydrolase domain-containing protein [Candidatus Solibacter sp.]|nr:serine hydrolase domain-containing protein [Candidatus Solibacter sp.]
MRTLTIIILLLTPSLSSSTNVAPQKIDEVFAAYSQHTPGCSVGVIRDGNFIFRKSYGEASLELSVPLTTDSIFYMASVSKQFTAASIVLAAEQGSLSLDDNVRKYIPELPDYSRPITLRQMLHHTSGLRDFLALTYLSGRDTSALSSAQSVLQLITRQKGLNNPPGEEFVYSNSNYFLLGVVIKRATGKSLAEFARANIFEPLGMAHTFFYDDNTTVIPYRAAAYDAGKDDPGKERQFLVDWSTLYDIVGGGGLMSSVNDLILWDRNFYSNKLGKGKLVRELETPGMLNNGHRINYGLGLWLGEYRGLRTVEHSGGTFGYRTELLRFPEQRFSVITLCNVENADVEGLARKVSDLYLEEQLKSGASETLPSGTLLESASFAGAYLDLRTHMIYTFTSVNGNLTAWGATLRRLGANKFSDLVGNPIVFQTVDGAMTATLTLQGEIYFSGTRVPAIYLAEADLKRFAGDYRSDELEATYSLSVMNGALKLRTSDRPPVDLSPVAPNEFQAGDLGTFVFQSGANRQVSGWTLFSQPARGITFRKIN